VAKPTGCALVDHYFLAGVAGRHAHASPGLSLAGFAGFLGATVNPVVSSAAPQVSKSACSIDNRRGRPSIWSLPGGVGCPSEDAVRRPSPRRARTRQPHDIPM